MESVTEGKTYTVGQFFWTSEEKCIGFSSDAHHGHDLSFGGSVDAGDKVQVLGVEGDEAIVKVLKEFTPYGAPCPHGMIFAMPVEQILSWPALLKKMEAQDDWRKAMSSKFRGYLDPNMRRSF